MAFTDRLANRGSVSTGYTVSNSMMCDATRAQYVDRAFAYDSGQSNHQTKKATYSCWVKRGDLGTTQYIFSASSSARVQGLYFDTDNHLHWNLSGATGFNTNHYTKAKFTDISAWYHIVWHFDTTQSTNEERHRVYVNGEEFLNNQFSGKDYWNENNVLIQNTVGEITAPGGPTTHAWGGKNGYSHSSTENGDLKLAQCYFIYDQALDCNSFGEFNDDGVWVPKQFTGTFGYDGYHLEFKTSALTADSSGNSRTFTLVNGADQTQDSPTNNFCNWNANSTEAAEIGHSSSNPDAFSGVNLLRQGGSSAYNPAFGTFGIWPARTTVNWYWEMLSTTNIASSGSPAEGTVGWARYNDIQSYVNSGVTNNIKNQGTTRYLSDYFSSSGANTVIGILLEASTSNVKVKIYVDDTLEYTGENLGEGQYFFPMVSVYGSSGEFVANFGGGILQEFGGTNSYSDPNGYGEFRFDTKGGYALCTQNLAEYGG